MDLKSFIFDNKTNIKKPNNPPKIFNIMSSISVTLNPPKNELINWNNSIDIVVNSEILKIDFILLKFWFIIGSKKPSGIKSIMLPSILIKNSFIANEVENEAERPLNELIVSLNGIKFVLAKTSIALWVSITNGNIVTLITISM